MSLGRATGVLNFLAERDLSRSFVAIERGAIAVGFLIGDVLLIGFRGTRFPFDWRINIRSQLIDYGPFDRWFHPRGRIFWPLGRVHRGFAEEAFRIALRVREEVAKIALKEEAKVYICGHSLGGAIAALSAPLLEDLGDLQAPRLFGSPRYADVAHYCSTRLDILPRQIKRENDLVPSVPPKKAGYADHPLEYDTSGNLRPTLQDASWAFPPSGVHHCFLEILLSHIL